MKFLGLLYTGEAPGLHNNNVLTHATIETVAGTLKSGEGHPEAHSGLISGLLQGYLQVHTGASSR